MKAMSVANKITESDRVIVRAFGDEPVELVAVAIGPDCIEVGGVADPRKTVGFPPEAVFRFDKELFGRLRGAYRNGRTEELVALWCEAVPYRGG